MVTLERREANYPNEKITKSYTAYLNNLNRPDIEEYNASVALFRVVRFGKTQFMMGIRQTLLTMVLLSSSLIAVAEPDHQRGTPPQQTGPHEPAERASFTTNHFEQRDNNNRPDNAEHRSGRLSPDERRELRRQINEVGQDIYRPRH
jgi:hypothetical protein